MKCVCMLYLLVCLISIAVNIFVFFVSGPPPPDLVASGVSD